jgi:hypothetical protein
MFGYHCSPDKRSLKVVTIARSNGQTTLPQEPLSAPEHTRDPQALALERVGALGRQWLAEDPEQLLQHFGCQAEQLLQVRAELQDCQAQLRDCQVELQQLQEASPTRQRRPLSAPLGGIGPSTEATRAQAGPFRGVAPLAAALSQR